jgi:hypothetical protein
MTSAAMATPIVKPMSSRPIWKWCIDLLSGEYNNPVRVVAFNTAEKWSQDVSADVAHESRQRCDLQERDVPFGLEEFMDRHEGRYHDVQLPLPIRLA